MTRNTTIAIGVMMALFAVPIGADEQAADEARAQMQAVHQENMAAPTEESDVGADELRAAIEALTKVEFEAEEDQPVAEEPAPQPTPVLPILQVDPNRPTTPEELRRVAPSLLARLKAISSERINDPIALADTLALAGHDLEAVVFYELALRDELSGEDEAWVIFQIANCLVSHDVDKAVASYSQLLVKFPDSAWAPVAQARIHLQEWFELNQPVAAVQQAANDVAEEKARAEAAKETARKATEAAQNSNKETADGDDEAVRVAAEDSSAAE
ncbi:MAG: tetratricopeptide repeat protein [Planctomycetota bacterium]|jgi:hypothetical protein